MTLGRPGLVQRSFHLDPLDRQTGSLVVVRPDLVNDLGGRQSVGVDSNGASSLQMIDELKNGRLVGGSVEVADQVVLPNHAHEAGVQTVGDRLAGTLKTGGGDTNAVLATV